MRRRTWLFCLVVALCPVLALFAWRYADAQGNSKLAAKDAISQSTAKKLPLTQVVLFNTGLGYFQREGEVEGEVRIDLSIPTNDVNDLLKSMLVENGGQPVSISYEGIEPIEHKLKAFAVDLASNPTLGQLLNQARGERIELTLEGTGGGSPTPMVGTIVGMEANFENQQREVHHLNVLCTDGVRRVALERVSRVRFLDPVVEEEFRRALSVLSSGRADQRRLVSITLKGEGKRKVKIGYVAETPVWKATYRLVLEARGVKPALQGWAIIENTTEEDWKDVRVVLVSGRPITFEMDLAQQLFMPRPKVDPEIYASLRPPTFAPAHGGDDQSRQAPMQQTLGQLGNNLRSQVQPNFQGNTFNPGMGQVGFGGGMIGMFANDPSRPAFGPGGQFNRYQSPNSNAQPRLSYDELQRRRADFLSKRQHAAHSARDVGSTLAAMGDRIDDLFTNADRIGEGFRYSVEPRVTLPRQRSGLLSVWNGAVGMTRQSIYSPSVHPRFPLHAVKLKNTSGMHLMQGPVAVYDGGEYVGDCRLPDMQPGQERLLTYAMDLGVEIRPEVTGTASEVTSVSVSKGDLSIQSRLERQTKYLVTNRSKEERLVVVEHAGSDWTLDKESAKPVESTRQTHRFEWPVAAGKAETHPVKEGRWQSTGMTILAANDVALEHAEEERRAEEGDHHGRRRAASAAAGSGAARGVDPEAAGGLGGAQARPGAV
jgi:hypothetical protein